MLQHDRTEKQPEPIAESASDDKQQTRGTLHGDSKVPVEDFVGREQLAGEVPRQQFRSHDPPTEDVAKRQLQKTEIAGVGHPGYAQESDRAGLGRDDRTQHSPPRHTAATDHELSGATDAPPHPHSEDDHAEQIAAKNCRIDPVNIHGGILGAGSGPHKPYPDLSSKLTRSREEKKPTIILLPQGEGGRRPDESAPSPEKNAVAT